MPPPPPFLLRLVSAGESSSDQTDTCLPACHSPLWALSALDLHTGTTSLLYAALWTAGEQRRGRREKPGYIDGWMDAGSRVSPWEVSMCARVRVFVLS